MSKKKKIIIASVCSVIAILIVINALLIIKNKQKSNESNEMVDNNVKITNTETKLKELPKPEITGGTRGELGIDKNINESTIDDYLNRKDSVYRDMRMLEDPGNYESIGGDSKLSGYIKGFEVVPLPYIIPVTGLPSEVGETYTGTTLFSDDNGKYVANYEESLDIINKLFPKNKVIFLMCGGGGYAGMMKNFLVSLGWNEEKIYNVGGYWYYEGKNNVPVKKEVNGVTVYDFDKVPYHEIDFNKLTKISDSKEDTVKVTELKINTTKIELEEGSTFKLNVIVLPNDATNKEVKWTSSNENVASVNSEGLVQAKENGEAVITAKSVDGEKTITCKVTVNKKVISTLVKMDNLYSEAEEYNSLDLIKLEREFNKLGHDENWREEYKKYTEKRETNVNRRAKILDDLVDNKKSFIVLFYSKECQKRDYSVIDGAEKILKENNYQYFYTYDATSGDETLGRTKLDFSKLSGGSGKTSGSIIIVKDGVAYARVNPDVDSLKSDEDTRNWLRKYIEIK